MTKGTSSTKGGQKGAGDGSLPATPPRRSARVSRAQDLGETIDIESAGKGPAPEAGGPPGAVDAMLAIKHEPKAARPTEQLTGPAPTLTTSARSAIAYKGEGGGTDKGPVPKEGKPSAEAQDSPVPSEEGEGRCDAWDPLYATSYAQVARVATGASPASLEKAQPGGAITPTKEKGQPERDWTPVKGKGRAVGKGHGEE